MYRDNAGVYEFVIDANSKTPGTIIQSSPFDNLDVATQKYHAQPQKDRASHGNTVGWPDSADLMSDVGYHNMGTTTPQLRPRGVNSTDDHIVFSYNSQFRNGSNDINNKIPLPGDGIRSLAMEDEIYVKIWTAESIELLSGATSTLAYNPFSKQTNVSFGNLRTWPNDKDPASRTGFGVSEYVSNSIWDRILRAVNPFNIISAISNAASMASVNVVCAIWEKAANVVSDGCEEELHFKPTAAGTDHWLSEQMPEIDADGKVVMLGGYRGLDPALAVHFT